jgi:hypothetical protein
MHTPLINGAPAHDGDSKMITQHKLPIVSVTLPALPTFGEAITTYIGVA